MSKILVVGGTGLTGAHAALHLRAAGNDVTLMSRATPTLPILQDFAHLCGDYTELDSITGVLHGFEQLVFAAGADIRLLPPGDDETAFYERVNVRAIPQFFEAARDAAITRAVYIGTYYPQVAPEKIESSPYVRSRHLADEGVRALSSEHFRVCSLNAPFILGHVEGLVLPHIQALVQYAAGRLEGMPLVAPEGGVNHISSQSMSEAIANALLSGRSGKAYLVGDENLSWKDYLQYFCECAGNPLDLPLTIDEHPLFPDVILYAGRGAVIDYEPDVGELNYRRNNVQVTINEVVGAYI